MDRPQTTLFMLMSVDGKISTGSKSHRDVDKDFPKIPELQKGLHQYYNLEQQTDLFSLNTGKVFEKIGVNEGKAFQNGVPVSFILIDNKPHLNESGMKHLLSKSQGVFLITTNKFHPAITLCRREKNLTVFMYEKEIDFRDAFAKLKSSGINQLTIQSGGTLNATLMREGLIDRIFLVIAPALIGGKETPTLIDGASLDTEEDLFKVRPLKLKKCEPLAHSYLQLEYDVINSQ